eukprot:scaffold7358_cov252-Pinguiococcus_pyrenoidosus.AAC.39
MRIQAVDGQGGLPAALRWLLAPRRADVFAVESLPGHAVFHGVGAVHSGAHCEVEAAARRSGGGPQRPPAPHQRAWPAAHVPGRQARSAPTGLQRPPHRWVLPALAGVRCQEVSTPAMPPARSPRRQDRCADADFLGPC